MKKFMIFCTMILISTASMAAGVIATVAGTPVTDADITARVKLMTLQGNTSTNNRRQALSNIIDDYVKIAYAENFKLSPDDKTVNEEIKAWKDKGFPMDSLSSTERAAMKGAVKANIAWQMVLGKTIAPTIQIEPEDIKAEVAELEKEKGLPMNITFIRLVDIPSDIAAKLTKPANCDDAMKIAEDLGGAPQKLTAVQYELSSDIRERIAGLPLLTWSPRVDDSVLLICSKNKTSEYGKLDDIIKQNAIFKRAMFMGDQILKQQRRKTIIVISDPAYKDVLN